MKIIEPSVSLLTSLSLETLKSIETAARTCYKSEANIDENSAVKMVQKLISKGHDATLEFADATFRVVCDRGVTHEIVRHRIASYAQESTRYCNYAKDKFGNELTFIRPCFWAENSPLYQSWYNSMKQAENTYLNMISEGATPQEARSVLPNSLKTEICVKMNMRQWRHFLNLRCAKDAHPQMRQIAFMILDVFRTVIPELVSDIVFGR